MNILIDREAMCVLYRHQDLNSVFNLMALECNHLAVVVMNEDHSYSTFTDLELKLLYQNLTGQKYTGYSREILENNVRGLMKALPETELVGFELAVQAHQAHNTGEEGDNRFYQYMRGQRIPAQYSTPYTAPALKLPAGYTPKQVAPETPPASVNAVAGVPAPLPAAPRPVTTPTSAPKAGSTTGRVWEIAEIQLEKLGSGNMKELRRAIVSACENEGINPSTASVQYGKWKTTKNL